MAEPGDPQAPDAPRPDPDLDDDAVGFASSAALQGRLRDGQRTPTVADPEAQPALIDPTPTWARETPSSVADTRPGTRREAPTDLDGAGGLYAVYALILFAVPTLGASALIALLAVTGRAGPSGDVATSHFVFQQRTLWAGAVVALAGAILVVVGLGVFVLFLLAVWLIVRGAAGVLKLKAGRAMPNPRGWLI